MGVENASLGDVTMKESSTTGQGTRVFPKIKFVRAYTAKEKELSGSTQDQGADCHDVDDEHWINGFPTPIANPMSGYAQYAGTRKSWGLDNIVVFSTFLILCQ